MSILTYELWDLDSGNRVAVFDSEAEALTLVREIYARQGPEAVSAFGLGAIREDQDGNAELVPVLDSGQLLAHVIEASATPSAHGRA